MPKNIYPQSIKDFLKHIDSYGSLQAISAYNNGGSLTYSELVDKIICVATNIKENWPIKPGDRIMLFSSGPDWVVSYFACLLCGYVVVPLDIRMNDDLISDLVALTEPKLIIKDVPGKALHYVESISTGNLSKKNMQRASLDSFEIINQDNIAEIILTSGTWSRPKGVTLTHKNILANLAGVDKTYQLADDARLLSILPLSHAYEQMIGLFVPLFRGASITYLQDITSNSLKEACGEQKITLIVAVPRILEVLHKEIMKKIPNSKRVFFENIVISSTNLPIYLRRKLYKKVHMALGRTLKTIVVGGAPLEYKLDKFFQGLGYELLVGYGLSETSPVISISKNQQRTKGDVGKPLHNIETKVSAKGEIIVRGESVFYGYWPEKRRGGFFCTGDLGSFDRKGNIILKGRIKNLIVFPNGDKIFLEDIEKIADSYSGVEESCALNIGNDRSPLLHLFIVANKTDNNALKEYINSKLPYGIRVASISKAKMRSLPRTHTLKLKRNQIIEYHAGQINHIKS